MPTSLVGVHVAEVKDRELDIIRLGACWRVEKPARRIARIAAVAAMFFVPLIFGSKHKKLKM
jgi:hypothetical protein